MRRSPITFRRLLEEVLPTDRLSREDQSRIDMVLRSGDAVQVERLGMEILTRLVDLGYLKPLGEAIERGEAVRRYRDLTSGNPIAIRTPAEEEDDAILRIPLPLRDWASGTSLDEVRTLFALSDKMLTPDSHQLRSTSDLLRQVLLTTRTILRCERVSFWAPEAEPGDETWQELLEPAYDEDLARDWVLDRNHLVVVPELPALIRPDSPELDTRFRSLAMVPIGAPGDATRGVVHAWSSRSHHFGEARQGSLGLIAESATDLLRRARVLENLVFVDAGTQVFNRTYFELQLDNEIARAKREGKSLALAIADIDDFREFNNRYGYEAGNTVLTTAAQVLRGGLRPFDSVARWGGEEFALVLTPPVTEEDARAVCERLRHATELSRLTVTGLQGETATTHLTVSIGGAVYPVDGSTAKSLWTSAEAALKRAKRTGKNRVVFATDLAADDNDTKSD